MFDLQTTPQQQSLPRLVPYFTSAFVWGREWLLDRVTGEQTAGHNRQALIGAVQAGGQVALPNAGEPGSSPDPAAALKLSLDQLQTAAVSPGGLRVDYSALRDSPAYADLLAQVMPRLKRFDPALLSDEPTKRAFWINLYNALVVVAVVEQGIETSVTEGWLGLVRFFRRPLVVVGEQRLSLDDIEHGILRANRGAIWLPGPHFEPNDPRLAWVLPLDPRVHFALNCGARSCPPIRIYAADRLDGQLDLATRSFAESTTELGPSPGELTVSRLFKWYGKDFGGRAGVEATLRRYLPEDERRSVLESGRPRLRYAEYDWRLNAGRFQ